MLSSPLVTTAERERGHAARDIAAVGAAVVLSFALYVADLGFYSDDWAFFGNYATSADQSLRGLYAASHSEQHEMRPVQLWLCAALYRAFGLNPVPHHMFNGTLLVLNSVLCLAIARELRISRTIALATALVYGLLPSYSTDRYWFVAFAITLSMTACLTSLYADLKALAARGVRQIAWKVVAAGALLVSGLAYEVALPLFLIVPLLMAWRVRDEFGALTRRHLAGIAVLVGINVALLAGVGVFKLRTTVRLGAQNGLAVQVAEIARHAVRRDLAPGEYGLNVVNAARVHFGDFGWRQPATAVRLAGRAPGNVRWLTLLFAAAAFAYLAWSVRQQPWPPVRQWLALVCAGAIVFALGYAIFLTNYNVQFTPTGIANRSAIAAALGAAMCIVGCIGLLATPLSPRRIGPVVFAALITLFASSGFLIVNVVARYWIDAYRTERAVLAGIQQRFPTLSADSTLILDGVCPYIGPAIVFESYWDLAGALHVVYRDRTLRADVVTERLAVGDLGITSRIYGQRATYPYGPRTIVYHAGTGQARPLDSAVGARRYFAERPAVPRCPPAREGIGVALF